MIFFWIFFFCPFNNWHFFLIFFLIFFFFHRNFLYLPKANVVHGKHFLNHYFCCKWTVFITNNNQNQLGVFRHWRNWVAMVESRTRRCQHVGIGSATNRRLWWHINGLYVFKKIACLVWFFRLTVSPFLGTKKGGGGRTESAFNYIIGAGGIESNHTYPYRAVDGQCKFNKNDVVAHISSYSE